MATDALTNTIQIAEQQRLNETVIDVLERLAKTMARRGDFMKSRIYTRAADTVMTIEEDITSVDQLKGRSHIGPVILAKLRDYMETGTLRIFEEEKGKPENVLSEVYGIGPKKAKDLVDKGVTTIEELRKQIGRAHV